MNQVKYYQPLDWPLVPVELCRRLTEFAQTATNAGTVNDSFYHHYELGPELESWFRNTLPIDDSYYIRLQKMFGVDRVPNHIDVARNEVANFLLSPGTAETRWYDDNENVVEQVVFPQYQWYRLKTDVLHSVENIKPYRLAVSVFQAILPRKEPKFWLKK